MKIYTAVCAALLCCAGTAATVSADTVVCFGDSITAGYQATGYPVYLQSMQSSSTIINEGVGGEDTWHGVSRFTEVLAARKPNYVVIMEGANDVVEGLSPSSTSYNLANMAQQARDAGAVPIMSTITPNSKPGYTPEDYNPGIIQAAASGGFTLVDTYSRVVNDWSRINVDGLHPTDAGSQMIAEGFSQALASVRSSPAASSSSVSNTTDSSSSSSTTTPSTSNTTTTASSSGGGSKSGCFIATAAYGSALQPQVVLLKKFRDLRLLTNAPGQAFVEFYYKHSPPIAAFIARHEPARLAVRFALLPLLAAAWLLVEAALWQQAVLTAAALLLAIAVWQRNKARHRLI